MPNTTEDLVRDELLTASQLAITAIGAMLAEKEREIERLEWELANANSEIRRLSIANNDSLAQPNPFRFVPSTLSNTAADKEE
jgi:hypothetical protein